MKIHRNLLWFRAEPTVMEQLLSDPAIARLVVARPAEDTAGVRREGYHELLSRLGKLGHVPKEVGRWA
ncbi:MAG: hypothetical protein AMXMBFR64_52320 [Myxococcales bacterium]